MGRLRMRPSLLWAGLVTVISVVPIKVTGQQTVTVSLVSTRAATIERTNTVGLPCQNQLYHLTHGIGRSCINGVFMKVYQTQSLSACYGCDRMGVIEFPRPADFVNRGYVINSARLDMFKHWDGRIHGWNGNNRYVVRAVQSNWTNETIVNATWDRSMDPAPLNTLRNTVTISNAINVWANVSILQTVNSAFVSTNGPISMSVAGEIRGCVSAFDGYATARAPRLTLTYTLLSNSPTRVPTARPTTPPTLFPTTLQPTQPPTDNPTTRQPTPTITAPPTTVAPTDHPTASPIHMPTDLPTQHPTTSRPTAIPTDTQPPTHLPSVAPTVAPPTTAEPTATGAATASSGSGGGGNDVAVIIVVVIIVLVVIGGLVVYHRRQNNPSAQTRTRAAPPTRPDGPGPAVVNPTFARAGMPSNDPQFRGVYKTGGNAKSGSKRGGTATSTPAFSMYATPAKAATEDEYEMPVSANPDYAAPAKAASGDLYESPVSSNPNYGTHAELMSGNMYASPVAANPNATRDDANRYATLQTRPAAATTASGPSLDDDMYVANTGEENTYSVPPESFAGFSES